MVTVTSTDFCMNGIAAPCYIDMGITHSPFLALDCSVYARQREAGALQIALNQHKVLRSSWCRTKVDMVLYKRLVYLPALAT